MVQQFITFCEQWSLIRSGDRALLAVSGGVDSVVMARLFTEAGFPFAIAHVNFRLRGEESDLDESFVRDLASAYAVPFYCERFDTATYAAEEGVSVQMAARVLRYRWFEQIRASEGFDLIATGHHRDDQIETFFIHLLRGTGIAGLHGIPVKQHRIIRPLLFSAREEILAYAAEKRLKFREDSSNAKTTYLRNKIRHDLLPALASIHPRYADAITSTIRHLQDSESLLLAVVEEKREQLFTPDGDQWHISIDALLKLNPLHPWLYALFAPFQFNEETIAALAESLTGEPGRQFFSPGYRLVKDRETLILMPGEQTKKASGEEIIPIPVNQQEITSPLHLTFHRSTGQSTQGISSDPAIATIDYDLIDEPLTLRKWQPGDAFYPFGMDRKKKLSDFFVDEKLSLPEKERVWLLCSDKSIIWVIGYRIDNRYRVTANTRSVLTITFHPE